MPTPIQQFKSAPCPVLDTVAVMVKDGTLVRAAQANGMVRERRPGGFTVDATWDKGKDVAHPAKNKAKDVAHDAKNKAKDRRR